MLSASRSIASSNVRRLRQGARPVDGYGSLATPQLVRNKKTATSQRLRPRPQLVEQATKPLGNTKSLWQSWSDLSVSSKLGIGLVFAAVGAGGLMASNYLEEQMPVQNDATRVKDPQRKPRLFGITVIDKQA